LLGSGIEGGKQRIYDAFKPGDKTGSRAVSDGQMSIFDAADTPTQAQDTVSPVNASSVKASREAAYAEYRHMQEDNPGAVVFYRLGGFYEAYGVAAVKTAQELGLSLIPMDIEPFGHMHMTGFPDNRLSDYLQILTDAGYSVIVFEPGQDGARTITHYPAEQTEGLLDYEGDDTANTAPPQSEPAPTDTIKPQNFHITPGIDIGGGGAKAKYRRNVEAIRLLQTIESESRYATPEEQAVLALYSGWGGVSQVFTEGHPDWQAEHAELKELLSEREYKAAAGSTLNAHYTSVEVIDGIYTALRRIGFMGGNVLEPAMGVGNFYGCMPEELAAASRLYGVELDSITGAIARQLYPNADIRVQGFETADLPDNFFDAPSATSRLGATS
jgi:hypothetical protein